MPVNYPGSSIYPSSAPPAPAPLPSALRLAATRQTAVQHEVLPWTGATTVTIFTAAGAQVGEPLSAAAVADADTFEVTIPASATADPGRLRLVWKETGGEQQEFATQVDVRDGNPFPLAVLTEMLKSGSKTVSAQYPAWMRRQALGDALLELEEECRCALVPTRETVTVGGRGYGSHVDVELPHVRRVVSTSVTGVDPVDIVIAEGGVLVFPIAVAAPFTVTVDHGKLGPAPDVARAISLLASARLAKGPSDERGFLLHGDGGAMRLLTAGIGGARFSIPDVEQAFRRNRFLRVG